jgi:hypothetical protein
MDLFCPHCTKRVTVADDKAGQVTTCPLCSKQFMAPSLAPPPVAPAPPPPALPPSSPVPVETYTTGPAPVSPPSPVTSPTATPSVPEPVIELPPPPPGEYTQTLGICLKASWLAFVPMACLGVIFVLSFFTWHNIDRDHAPSLWGMSFIEQRVDEAPARQGHFLAYTILMFLTFPLILVALILDLGFAPPQLAPILPWKSLAIGLFLGLTFMLLLFDYADAHLLQRLNPIALPEKLAIRLHFVAMMSCFGMFWLHWRKPRNLPPPKLEAHW